MPSTADFFFLIRNVFSLLNLKIFLMSILDIFTEKPIFRKSRVILC